jgi:ammonium transporter, Amt family
VGGIAAGIFGLEVLGGLGGVTFFAQLAGTLMGIVIAFAGGWVIYGAVKAAMGLRMSKEEEYLGADLSIHRITAQPDYNRGEV